MMKRKNVIIILTLLVIVLLAACGNDKTNENNETMDNRKFTQEKISELEKEVKGGTHEFAILVSVEERYNVSAGNYEVTDGKQTDLSALLFPKKLGSIENVIDKRPNLSMYVA